MVEALGRLTGAVFVRVFGADVADVFRRRVARGAAGVFSVRLIANVLAIGTGVVLARTLRADGYGTYVLALSWVRVLAVPATLGQPRLLIREVAVYAARGSWGLLRGLLAWSSRVALAVSILLASATGFGLWATGVLQPRDAPSVYLALAMVPVLALVRLRQSALQGLRHVVAGQLPELVIKPVIFLAAFVVLEFGLGLHLQPLATVGLAVATTVLAFGAGAWSLCRRLPPEVRAAQPAYEATAWWSAGLPLAFVSVMAVVAGELDVLMLGVLKGGSTAGIFRVADRGAQLVVFVMFAANVAVAPMMARLYAEGRIEDLQQLTTRSARAVLLASVPVALLLLLFGRWFLLLFGAEFVAGRTALVVLVVAQLVSACAGLVNTLLIMTGHERDLAVVLAASTALNAALNVALIPRYGATGAAVATLASLTGAQLVAIAWLHRRTGLNATGFGRLIQAGGSSGTG